MSKKTFFDLDSKNTFNQLGCYVFDGPKEPINLEDYWVTKRFYSIGQTIDNYWRHIVETWDSVFPNQIVLRLNCKHTTTTDLLSIRNVRSFRHIKVNCMDCGGTGKIEIHE